MQKLIKFLVATDTANWQQVYATSDGKDGEKIFRFKPVMNTVHKNAGNKVSTPLGLFFV